ncbi:AAA family ATPase [Candidatus Falkowbacteria bacterium]|nr:AAA family ATPase [Candidatus Falkowbacteria bacterium]
MANKIILGFVGEISSGKGTACQYLKEKYGAPSYRFSGILRDILGRLYLPIVRDNMQHMSQTLRKNFGQDTLARVIAEDVNKDSAELIAVDGVRREPDIKYLRRFAGFSLIYLTADQPIRYERIIKRGENVDDTSKTFEQFQQDERAEAEIHILETGQTANFTINNNGTIEQLHQQIEDILKTIKAKNN